MGGVVGACLLGAFVGASADEVALVNKVVDDGASAVVLLDEGGIRIPCDGIDEEQTASKRGVVLRVNRACLDAVEQEDDTVAGLRERGPLAGFDGGIEGGVRAANFVGRDDLFRLENGADFSVESVEPCGGERLGEGCVRESLHRPFLGLDKDE